MKLIIGEQQFEYTGQPTAEDVIERINENLAKGLYFSHFVADGKEIYDEHEEFLERKLGEIEELHVIIKTEKEFMNDVLLSAEEYLKRAIPEVRVLADEFNRVPTGDTWDRFELLVGGAGWLNDMLQVVSNSEERPTNWKTFHELTSSLQAEVSKLGKAVEKKKNGEIATILKKGFFPIFEQLEKKFGETIDSEFVRKNLN
ncbi:hypothetical protein SLU01_13040 [Sporosarcina luteola]|uniref:Uncharacterized protein n=1 Tax=Sporosarcina luteola TaxID=582850 RepID=A0A511Z6C6_9BACL|nr:hypothetical protein [Sporosarcina luteola]GEN82992.1 hypothetical protein SLU01_13040 [Sporosarcina luteola]